MWSEKIMPNKKLFYQCKENKENKMYIGRGGKRAARTLITYREWM